MHFRSLYFRNPSQGGLAGVGASEATQHDDGRRPYRIRVPLVAGLLFAALHPACASTRNENPGFILPRPADCELLEVGPIYVPYYYRPGRGGSHRSTLYDRVRQLGYDRITDVRRVTELRGSPGSRTEYLVGWEGVVWRWNNAACRRRD